MVAANERLIAAAKAERLAANPGDVSRAGQVAPPRADDCIVAGSGGWAKAYRVISLTPRHFEWDLVYLGNAKSTLAPVTEDQEFSTTTDLRSFDFNADGVPEVWYTRHESGPEGGSDDPLSAFTISNAEIKPFDLAGANVVRDVDGDGRPDLLLELRNPELRLSCPGYAFESVEGPTFLLHSLASGAFSATDEIARGFVRHSCPRAPARVVEPSKTGGGYVDDDKTAVNVVCARAWGMPLAALRDALKTGCQPFAPRADCENDLRPRPHECRYRDELLRWAELTPVVFAQD